MGKGLVAALRQRIKEIHLQLEKMSRIILNLWANSFFYRLVFTLVIRPIQQHRCSNIHLFLIYVACFNWQFQPLSGEVTKTKKKVKLIKLRKWPPFLQCYSNLN